MLHTADKQVPMTHSRFTLFAVIALILTAGCATRPSAPSQSEVARPFIIERDLAGETTARGKFKPIIGAARHFTAYLNGEWDGETLTLVEDFEFDDGETDRKTWRLTKTGEGEFTGTREDVVGEAVGFTDGAAFRLEYVVRLGGDGGRKVKFRDILYNTGDGTVLNKATVGYFGLKVGKVILEIERADSVQ